MDLEVDTNDAVGGAPQTVDEIRRSISNKPPREYSDSRPRRRSGSKSKPRPGYPESHRKRHATASDRSSILAQQWVDAGNAAGFQFPYDVNFFALALQAKIEGDSEFQKLLRKDEHDKVERWVEKMIERWWAEYLSNEITPANAKGYFLDIDWDDLQEYARTCLRAAYLLKHGTRKQRDVVALADGKRFRDHMAELEAEQQVSAYVDRTLSKESTALELDPKGRDRLRSWREKRSKK